MVVSVEKKYILAAALFLLGLFGGWLIWGANPSGRYQRVSGSGYVFDTKTGDYVDPSTGRTLREVTKEEDARRAHLALWNIVKCAPPDQISNERVRQEMLKRGHDIPDDFDDEFNKARRWVEVNKYVVCEQP